MSSSIFQDSSVTEYINRVRKLPLLSREDEHELAVAAKGGDRQATDKLVEANLRYVVAVALQYRKYGIRLADLVAEGNLGLMMAVRKFDPDRGTRFVTYAGYWIRALILDMVVRSTTMVGGGSGPFRSKVFFRLRRERAKLANLDGDTTQHNAILAESFGVSPERMQEMTSRLDARDVSLDAEVYNDSKVSLVETLADDKTVGQDAMIERIEEKASQDSSVERALKVLDPRERFIIERRIMRDEALSLAEIGRKLGVSRERARQLEARAKKKLEHELQAQARAA